MPVQYPAHLYVRVDRRLRDDLAAAAEHAGQNVSAFARGVLRTALGTASNHGAAKHDVADDGPRQRRGGHA